MTVRATGWLALALLGLVIAAGASVAASRILVPQVGISSEPVTAGSGLAPGSVSRTPKPSPDSARDRKPGTARHPGGAERAPGPATTQPGGEAHQGAGGDGDADGDADD